MTTSKQNRINISLAPGSEGDEQKASLEWLALKLGFRGNISALVRSIARTAAISPVDLAAAMEQAVAVAAAGGGTNEQLVGQRFYIGAPGYEGFADILSVGANGIVYARSIFDDTIHAVESCYIVTEDF